jgi:hypothetical protein
METDHSKVEYRHELAWVRTDFPLSQISTLSRWDRVKGEREKENSLSPFRRAGRTGQNHSPCSCFLWIINSIQSN